MTLRRQFERHALLLQDALELLADLGVHAGQDAVEKFDHRHLRAEAAPHRAELEPDHAGADHEQLLRHLVERERAGRRHDALLVDLDALQPRDIRAGRDDDVLRLDRLRLAVRALHLDLAGRRDAAVADEGIDLVLLEQERDALDVAVDALVLEFHHRRQIELRRWHLDAHAWRSRARPPRTAREACSSALDGMQPTLRQVPPKVASFSTTATFRPSCAARIAQT